MMELLQKLELFLVKLYSHKDIPKLPDKARKDVADVAWIIAIFLGIAQLWVTWAFWYGGHQLNFVRDVSESFLRTYGYAPVTPKLSMMYYLTFTISALTAAMLLLAAPNLKAHKKKNGWDLLLYSTVVYAIYGLARAFVAYQGNLLDFLLSLLMAVLMGYILFQIRGNFMLSPPKKTNNSEKGETLDAKDKS